MRIKLQNEQNWAFHEVFIPPLSSIMAGGAGRYTHWAGYGRDVPREMRQRGLMVYQILDHYSNYELIVILFDKELSMHMFSSTPHGWQTTAAL